MPADEKTEAADGPAAHDPFDPAYLHGLIDELWGPIFHHYFRPRILGLENLPKHGPAVIAGNHSGTAFPYDGMVLDPLIWHQEGEPVATRVRGVFEKALSFNWWMRPFGIDNFWRRCGGVDMTFDNFSRLLERGDRVLYFPEGVPGIGKGFQRRYQLQRFSTSFVLLAARHRAPVIPVYIVNAEWVIPFNITIKPLDRLLSKLLGIPFFPLPAGLLTPFFPFLFYLALPARLVMVIGEPLAVAKMAEEAGLDDLDHPDRDKLAGIAKRIRLHMQAELDRQVERHGGKPYDLRSLWGSIRRPRIHRSWLIPFLWPWLFLRHERNLHREPARNRLHAFVRDWDAVGYYLPLGWLFLALTRRFRRPPYGFRGLSRTERRRREGAYVWHLAERPLPPPAREPED